MINCQLQTYKLILGLLIAIWLVPAYSVAYCALRDPVTKIYTLFPNATTFRTIIHEIGMDAQSEVKDRAPFSLHEDELGKHTLYIAFQDESALGVIQSRSEVGLWGMVEIVWAFDFDLNVVDFMFQRCRETSCEEIEKQPFREFLMGKSAAQLSAILEQNNVPLPEGISGNRDAEVLAKTVIQSAIKTALVTEISWREDLQTFNPSLAE